MPAPGAACLLARVGTRSCAIPLEVVAETMRPLRIEPLAGMPPFVLGLSVVRGTPIPVVDVARLLGAAESPPITRFVSIRVGSRQAVLAVEAVLGVQVFSQSSLDELPPLMGRESADLVETIGRLDSALLLVLKSGRLVPSSAWAAADAEARS